MLSILALLRSRAPPNRCGPAADVHYFTARVMPERSDPRKPDRQAACLEALDSLPDVRIHFGRYARRWRRCRACGARWLTYKEKLTDVNVAVELLGDAQVTDFDTAFVVSADGDLAGLVGAVPTRFLAKRVVVAFPPGRQVLRDSQLPRRVTTARGYVVTRPRERR